MKRFIIKHYLCVFFISFLLALTQLVLMTPSLASEEPPKVLSIDFEQLEPDWWTKWEHFNTEQKQHFVIQIKDNFDHYMQQPQQHIAWTSLQSDVQKVLDNLQNLPAQKIVYDSPHLPQAITLTLIEWKKLYEQHKKHEALAEVQGKDSEARYDTVKASLDRIRSLVVTYRNQSDPVLKSQEGAQLFIAQLNHMTYIEELHRSKKVLIQAQSDLKKLKESLVNYTRRIRFDEKVQSYLQRSRKAFEKQLLQLEKEAISLDKRRQTLLPDQPKLQQLKLELLYLENSVKINQTELSIMSNDILSDINFVLNDPSSIIDNEWNKRLETKETELVRLQEQNSFIRLQLLSVSYEEEKSKPYQSMWQRFQGIQKLGFDSQTILTDAEFYLKTLSTVYVANRGWFALFGSRLGQLQESIELTWQDIIYYPLFTINESPVTPLDLLNIVVIILIAILFSMSIRRALSRLVDKYEVSESTTFTVGRVLHYTIITSAILFALSSLGLDFSKIALVAGALSVGIGFGLQSIFNNFVSGLILLFERPLKVGDIVELESGVKGHIRAINVRSTRVTTRDNIDILVPNSEFVNGRVTNYTFADPTRRIHIPFKVALGSDKEAVKSAGLVAASRVKYTGQSKGKKPDVWLTEFGESYLGFALVVWVNSHRSPNDNYLFAVYNWEIETALNEAGIEIPIPYQKVILTREKTNDT